MKRAALYARFSSDLQKDRSIDDQLAACQKVAARDNLKIVATFTDRAKSGASMFERDGLLDLMKAAKAKQFDVLIVEALDRLSRDQEDMHGIFKRFKFWDIDINTVNEGVATSLHVGIRGIVSELFLKDLGHKVKRGMNGRARDGLVPGALSYGYTTVPGKPGERQIDRDQEKVVVRVFREFVSGVSPRAIALGLTRDKIPAPRGVAWTAQAIVSGANGRKRGIISNPIYIGQIVWGTHRVEKNPETGKGVMKLNPKTEVITSEVPHLRIIDQALWDAAQKMRDDRSVPSRNGNAGKTVARTDYLLRGLLRCEACGNVMRIQGQADGHPLVACSVAYNNGTCDHSRRYNLNQLERTVVAGLGDLLADPEKFARFEKGFMSQLEKKKLDTSDLNAAQKKLNQVTVQIDRVVNAIASMDSTPVQALTSKLDALERERVGLAERVRLLQAESAVVKLHPTAMKAYRQNLVKLLRSLSGTTTTPEDHAAFRMLFDSIVVHRTAKRMPYEITPYARISGTMDVNLAPPKRTSSQVLEDAGVSYCGNANKGKPLLAIQQDSKVICLGRWKQAA